MSSLWWLVPVFFMIAMVYASVGHGGASGYLAVLSFIAVQPDQMSTTALTLNLLVAGLALVSFVRAGHFIGRLTWPFVLASVPAAVVGGLLPVPIRLYAMLLAAALCVAAFRLAVELHTKAEASLRPPSLAVALPVGGSIGWLSGVVGVGGGIFLSPLLLLCRWATPKQAAASASAFVLVNSAASLIGRAARAGLVYDTTWPLLAAALCGGLIGAHVGANHFSGQTLRRVLAGVLLLAAAKLLFVAWRAA